MSRQGWIIASACGLALFLIFVLAQDSLESTYDPLRQGISEFVHQQAGALLVIGLLVWASSLAILAGVLLGSRGSTGSQGIRLEGIGIGIAAAGLLLAACFPTDRGAEVPAAVTEATISGRLHDLGSATTAVGIFLAMAAGAAYDRGGRRILVLAIGGAAIASSVVLFALGDPLPGLRQRCLVFAASLWQAILLWGLWREAATSA